MSSASSAALPVAHVERRPSRTLERAFFAGMSLLLLAAVLFGFAHTYFLAGMVAAPLPNKLVHIHGAVFTLWILFLVLQTALVTTRNLKVHRALGMYGFGLAAVMCVIGPLVARDQLHRGHVPFGISPQTFFVIPLSAIATFAIFVAWAYRARFQPAVHKRMILFGTIVICDAAVGRWPVSALQQHPPLQSFVLLGFAALIAAFDLVSLHKIHKATAWGFLILTIEQFTRIPLAQTHAWQAFANFWLRH